MANWEVTKTKRYNKPIEEHTANTKSGSYKIEAPEGSRSGVLYRWDDLRGFERIASGDIASLKQQAESMGKKEARGVAGIERLANMSRPGTPDRFAVEDRFYFGKGRKERFGYNWWSQQQQELVPAALRASSSARMAAADLQRLATRLEAQGKFLKGVKQQDLTGTNQKLYDAVYEIIADVQKVKDLLGG